MTEFEEEGGTVLQQEVSIKVGDVNIRTDFVGIKEDVLYLYEVKNGPFASFTPNQKLAIPILQETHPSFIPFGKNGLLVPQFQNLIPYRVPYSGDYIFRVIHY